MLAILYPDRGPFNGQLLPGIEVKKFVIEKG
jgi:hypothetical protein